ncbi:hypothetical protein GQR58_030347 [Nymphon striatum]|nr:hypothetical protein GQR58_030347 [Nymphon striatum]
MAGRPSEPKAVTVGFDVPDTPTEVWSSGDVKGACRYRCRHEPVEGADYHADTREIGAQAQELSIPTVMLTHLIPAPNTDADRQLYVDDLRQGGYTGEIIVCDDLFSHTRRRNPEALGELVMAHIEPLAREDLAEFEPGFKIVEEMMGFVPNSMFTMARVPGFVAGIPGPWRRGVGQPDHSA